MLCRWSFRTRHAVRASLRPLCVSPSRLLLFSALFGFVLCVANAGRVRLYEGSGARVSKIASRCMEVSSVARILFPSS